jgi:hypothetical protein
LRRHFQLLLMACQCPALLPGLLPPLLLPLLLLARMLRRAAEGWLLAPPVGRWSAVQSVTCGIACGMM